MAPLSKEKRNLETFLENKNHLKIESFGILSIKIIEQFLSIIHYFSHVLISCHTF